MPKLKPIYLYLGLSVLIVIIGLILKITSLKSPLQTTLSSTPPPLPSGIQNPYSDFKIVGNLPQIPPTYIIPEYSITPTTTENIIASLSKTFNMGIPQTIQFPNGQTKSTWKFESTELNYYPDRYSLNYFNPSILNSQSPLSNDLVDSAEKFIQSRLPLSSSVSFVLIDTRYLQANESVAKEVPSLSQANLVEYEYRYFLKEKPVYFGTYGEPDIIISLNSQGVRNFKAKIPPQISTTGHQNKITSGSDQIKQSITDREYTIVRVDNQQYYEAGPLFNASLMTIKSTEVGYIINSDQIYPVYIIRGLAPHLSDPKTSYDLELAITIAPL